MLRSCSTERTEAGADTTTGRYHPMTKLTREDFVDSILQFNTLSSGPVFMAVSKSSSYHPSHWNLWGAL